MFFGIIDYLNYKNRRGRYANRNLEMSGYLPGSKYIGCVEQLEPGDTLVVHTKDSLLSWLVMYHTASFASHVCGYLTEGIVFDITLEGFLEHPISDYFCDEYWLSISRPKKDRRPSDFKEKFLSSYMNDREEYLRSRFSWATIIHMWFEEITCGKNNCGFRWSLYADYVSAIGLVALLAYLFESFLSINHTISTGLIGISVLYASIVIYNILRHGLPRPQKIVFDRVVCIPNANSTNIRKTGDDILD